METKYLTKEEVGIAAPAALATSKAPGLSERYSFISTEAIIDQLALLGWNPVNAMQGRSRRISPLHQTHMVTFRNRDISVEVGGIVPQMNLVNNHGGIKSWELFSGFLKLLCSNGLMVSTGIGEYQAFRIHKGEVSIEIAKMVAQAEITIGSAIHDVEEWKQIDLSPMEELGFAMGALKLRNSESKGDSRPLLERRRSEALGHDLWTVFNVVQENVTQGGVSGVFSRRRIRRITGVTANQKINQGLWSLAALYAARAKGELAAMPTLG